MGIWATKLKGPPRWVTIGIRAVKPVVTMVVTLGIRAIRPLVTISTRTINLKRPKTHGYHGHSMAIRARPKTLSCHTYSGYKLQRAKTLWLGYKTLAYHAWIRATNLEGSKPVVPWLPWVFRL